VIWVGFSWIALVVAVALYVLRMFAITGFYHRYFRTVPSKPRAWGSSFSGCWAPPPFSAGRSGGRHTTAITTCFRTSPRMCIPIQHGFFGATWLFMSHKHFVADLSRVKDC